MGFTGGVGLSLSDTTAMSRDPRPAGPRIGRISDPACPMVPPQGANQQRARAAGWSLYVAVAAGRLAQRPVPSQAAPSRCRRCTMNELQTATAYQAAGRRNQVGGDSHDVWHAAPTPSK